MSTVTLSYVEHNRLRAQEQRAQEAERRAAAERRRNTELNNRINTLRRQQTEAANTINDLNSANNALRGQVDAANRQADETRRQISDMERAHREQRAAMERSINEMNRSIRNDREQNEAFQERVRNQFGAINVAMEDLSQRLDTQTEAIRTEVSEAIRRQEEAMAQRTRNEEERARETVAELRRYLADLKPLEPERFYPGTYSVLERQAESAEADIENGQMQSSLAVSQVAVAQAAETYIRTRVLRQAFEERLAEARVVAAHALETIESEEQELAAEIARRAEELENGCPAEAMKPDYWNDGRFAELRRRRQEIQNHLDHMERNVWTPANLEDAIQNLVEIENEALESRRIVGNHLDRYFDALVDGVGTIREVLGESWGCTRYEHSEPGNLKSPIQMVFDDGFGHELPMILDVSPEALEQTSLGMTVVGDDEETIGEDREIILDDIRERLVENGMQIQSSHVEHGNCHAVARSADTYFASSRVKKPQGRKV